MTNRVCRSILVAALAVALGWPLVGPAPAQAAEHKLRIGSVAPTGTPWSALLARARKRIEDRTDGRIDVKLYLGGKLGSEGSLVRRCQKGQLGGIAVSNGALGQAVPELYATELPYMFDTHEQAYSALDAAIPLVRELLADKDFVFYMWGENGYRQFASKEKTFETPSALAGTKMRSQPAMPHVEMYKALGASAATIPVGEVTSSLANDVVSGYDNTLLYAYATQWHKEVRYVTLSDHIYQAAVVVWCKPWFDGLPKDLQDALMEVPDGEVKKGRLAVRAMNKRLEKEYEKDGVEMKRLSDAEKKAFAEATAKVTEKFLAETTAQGRKLLELLRANR